MALRLVGVALRQAVSRQALQSQVASVHTLEKVGKREIVGHGWNGTACYADRVDYPMPAIRFREDTPEIVALREKEKGDWKKISLEEKKALYRASFCQTFAEMKAPTGEWKLHVGMACLFASAAIFISLLLNIYIYPENPPTLEESRQKAQLKRMIDLEVNPVTGLASKWDYENNRWKN